MKIHASVSSLLVFSTLGFLAGAELLVSKLANNVVSDLLDECKDFIDVEEVLNPQRFIDEIKSFPKGLMVYDDDENLVEVTLDVGADEEESEEETKLAIADRVKFYLYTRKNPVTRQEIFVNNNEALASSNFDPEKPTRFVTHGWINSARSPACTLIRKAYLKNDDVNVIVVDWSKITFKPYIWASRRVVMVGQQVARMIDFLEKNHKLDPAKTTLVGHSLGAHVMGLAGYYAQSTVNYVIGLDPALPMFLLAGPGSRISTHDANHVQIIHTNAGMLGYVDAIGHADFYPNGGTVQPGCIADPGGACSHARSFRFFAESINSQTGFHGKPCNSFLHYASGVCRTDVTAVMGGALIKNASPGKYFLATNRRSAFAKGL